MDLTISYGDFKRVLTIKIKEMMYYLSSSHTTSNFQDPIKIMHCKNKSVLYLVIIKTLFVTLINV